MDDCAKQAYLLLGFTEEKPSNSGKYVCTCMESEHQPYVITVCADSQTVEDVHLGTTDLHSYHCGLTDLMYKRIDGQPSTTLT